MPTRPLPRCSYPGCPERANGRCTAHTPQRNRSKDRPDRPSPAQRGYDSQHRRDSKACITDQPWCSWCGAETDLVADHLVAGLPEYGYQTLCRSCNTKRRNQQHARPTPTMFVLCGLPGSGKSTYARSIPHAITLSADECLDGVPPSQVFASIEQQASRILAAGGTVIIDACSTQRHRRKQWLTLAQRHNAPAHIIVLNTPMALIVNRLQARGDNRLIGPVKLARYHTDMTDTLASIRDETWATVTIR